MKPARTGPASPPETEPYPDGRSERDRWIRSRRPPRFQVNPWRPHGCLVEPECAHSGDVVRVATVFLTNRECPWHCLMCDLWKTTLIDRVPPGAIPQQIDSAFRELGMTPQPQPADRVGPIAQLKLYNGGSFFDQGAIPRSDYDAIAERVCGFERVVVECHPALVDDMCLRFQDKLAQAAERVYPGNSRAPRLEVAMGLETAHPGVLEKLNKRMTLDLFASAAGFLNRHGLELRAFVLVRPPFLSEAEGLYWAERSIEFAFGNGAAVVSLIPTRAGNGALEALQAQGLFCPPALSTLEAALEFGLRLARGRVFADLWDVEAFAACPECLGERRERLGRMNLGQRVLPSVVCGACGAGGG